MNPFHYVMARSLEQAKEALAEYTPGAALLAGGTDLLIEWRRPAARAPRTVIDISRIGELRGIGMEEGMVVIKPLCTHAEIMSSQTLRTFAPLLSASAATIGSPQIRNRGTVGGNIMNAAACADTVPPLAALNARVTLQSRSGKREIQMVDLFVKPYHTRAKDDEILTRIRFEGLTPRKRSAFLKLGRRNALSISRLSVAVILEQDGSGKIVDARIVPGAALPVWERMREAEGLLLGQIPSPELCASAGRKVAEEMIVRTGRRWSTPYKEPVMAVLVRRALEQCMRPEFRRPPENG